MKIKQWGFIGVASLVMVAGCSGGSESGPKMSEDGKKIVVVGTAGSTRFLEEAEKAFEAKHPDIDIQIKKYGPEEKKNDGGGMVTGQVLTRDEYDQFITRLNTEVLSGKGPDLMDTTGLSLGVYANKGAVIDLHEMMKKDQEFKASDYYEGLWKATEINGGLYALPTNYFVNTMMVDTKRLDQAGVKLDDTKWTWNDFFDIADKIKKSSSDEVYSLGTNGPKGELLYSIVEADYERYVQHDKKTANFNSDEFRAVMQHVKDLYDKGFITNYDGSLDKLMFTQNTYVSPEMLAAFSYTPGWKSVLPPTSAGTSTGLPFQPSGSYSINAKSGVKDEAWQFLKFMLSPDMQKSPELRGIPMLKDAVHKKFEELKKQVMDGTSQIAVQINDPKEFARHVDDIQAMLNKTGKPSAMDPKISTIISDEFKTFLDGSKSAEDVSQLIQSRVMTYLNE